MYQAENTIKNYYLEVKLNTRNEELRHLIDSTKIKSQNINQDLAKVVESSKAELINRLKPKEEE